MKEFFEVVIRYDLRNGKVPSKLRKDEPQTLSDTAQRVLKVLRREHELATADLRAESRVTERAAFTRALDELQRQMQVIPQDVIYQPFSYIWMLAEDRWPEELRKRGDESDVAARRKTALREIARAYLAGAGMTLLGEIRQRGEVYTLVRAKQRVLPNNNEYHRSIVA